VLKLPSNPYHLIPLLRQLTDPIFSPLREYSISVHLSHVLLFRGLDLDGQCDPVQSEIDTLEACADEVHTSVGHQKAVRKRLREELVRLKEYESSISDDVDELTQALHDDVIDDFSPIFYCICRVSHEKWSTHKHDLQAYLLIYFLCSTLCK